MIKNILLIAFFCVITTKVQSQTTAADYYPWYSLIYTVETISKYDDDKTIMIQFKDQYNGIMPLWMSTSDNIDLSMLLTAKSAGLKVMVAFDNSKGVTRIYPKEHPQPATITAYRLKKVRLN